MTGTFRYQKQKSTTENINLISPISHGDSPKKNENNVEMLLCLESKIKLCKITTSQFYKIQLKKNSPYNELASSNESDMLAAIRSKTDTA